MIKVKKALVWSFLHNENHPSLTKKDRTIEGAMPLVDGLFPGINYFSITGFAQVSRDYLLPVLRKLYPEVARASAEEIDSRSTIDIDPFLPSKGYEHEDDPRWRRKLESKLNA